MKHLGLRASSALALAAVAWPVPIQAQAAAQPPAAAAQVPAGWEVNWGEQHCMLIRNSGGPGNKAFVLRRVPGSEPTDLITTDPSPPSDSVPSRRAISIRLTPASGEALDGRLVRAGRVTSGNMVIEMRGGDELLDRFAASSAIEVAAGGRSYFRMSYPSPTEALAALRQCEDDALRGWGIDASLIDGVRTRPRQINREMMVSDDYPVEAIRAHQEGTVLVRMVIDTDGRAEDCAIVATSGFAALDQATCALAQRRGRFRPATGTDGQPMRSVYVLRVFWSLPDN